MAVQGTEEDFLHRPQLTPPRPNWTRNPWCPRCNRNHVGRCIQGRQCFICGSTGHMRKECPTLHGYPNLGIGTDRRTMGAAPFPVSQQPTKRPFNSTRPAMTQSSVQQPRAQGRMNALTQQEAQASNAAVEGITCIMGHTA